MTVPETPSSTAVPRAPSGASAIVIGSGFGGLAAAVRLGARGYRVLILEQLDAPGGRAYVHRQDGFTFDAGPTIVTAPFVFEDLWSLCGRRLADDVTLKPLAPFYRVRFHDGSFIDWSGDEAAMRAQITRLAPADLAGYERFLQLSARIYKIAFEQLGHVPFSRWQDMARLAPALLRLSAHESLYSRVAAHVRDPRLRFALSFHPLFVGGNPFTTSALYGLIVHLERKAGVHYAMGGTGRLVQGLLGLIAQQGGSVRYGVEARRITLRGRVATGVELASGERLESDIVVSNADCAWTYGQMLPRELPRRWSDRRLRRMRYSMSLFVWYFGTRRQYPEVGHHTILVGPRYRELITDIFQRHVLAEDFSLYLHRPSASDPSVAPPGCDAFYVLAPVPNQLSGIDWKERAEPYRRLIAARLSEDLLPNLEQNVVTSRLMTPQDFKDRLLSYQGAAFGMEPILTQSAWFRPHNQCEDIERLYLVGAGTHPGAGLPGVVSSARVLDAVVPHGSTFA
jgi:phytoene desaturase